MDQDEARRRLNATLKRHGQRWYTDAEFSRAMLGFGSDYEVGEEEDFAERAAEYIMFGRDVASEVPNYPDVVRRAGETESVAPPEWWTAEWQRRVLQGCPAHVRDRLWAQFGLVSDDGETPRPCRDHGEALSVLRAARSREVARGRRTGLSVPYWILSRTDPSADDLRHSWDVWQGEGQFDPEFPLAEGQPLFQLAVLLDNLQEQVHCSLFEAFDWLLLDEPIPGRWLDLDMEPSYRIPANPDDLRITITVWSPMVPAVEVAWAYAYGRRELLGEGSERRAPHLWPRRAEGFVCEWEQTGSPGRWKAAFDAFKARYPGQPYGGMRSFRQAVYDRRRKDAP